jgi:hypothetical protein
MIEVCDKQNIRLGYQQRTHFTIRVDGVFQGKYTVLGWNAEDGRCLAEYNRQTEDD